MNTALISALIALIGVITSVTLSFFSNKRLLKTEIEKLEVGIEQNYAKILVEKRLECYPSIYEPISNMSKKIRRMTIENQGEKIFLKDIIEFQKIYDDLNSKYGVVYSSVSSAKSKFLRVYLSDIIVKFKRTNLESEMPVDILTNLKKHLGDLEFSLKQDIGIYIVEFKDPKRKLQLQEYEDVTRYRETIKPKHSNL